jgi:hypothetical protein
MIARPGRRGRPRRFESVSFADTAAVTNTLVAVAREFCA